MHAAFGRCAAQAVTRGNQTGVRLFASLPPGGVEWIMVLCNMQVQDVLVREVSLAFRTPVHVRFTVVHVILVDGGKSKGLMRREQALHDGWLLTHSSRLGVELDEFDVGRCLA